MIRSRNLRPGDTIGIIAPSLPISEASAELIERGYDRLRERGFHVVEAPQGRQRKGHAAGSVAARVEALHEFFADPRIHGILTFWGGWQSHQLLEYLDEELIRTHPKPLIGYSDITALLLGIFTRTGLVTFLGPGAVTFGKPILFDYTWESFRRTLMEPVAPMRLEPSSVFTDNPWWLEPGGQMVIRPAPSPSWRCYQPGRVSGPLLGGNLSTMLLLSGTRWWPDLDGAILLVEEDADERPWTIDRLFTRLRHLGVFSQVRGLVVGRFPSRCGFHAGDSLEMILEDALRGHDLPVLLDVDFGHTDPLLTLPLGIPAVLDAGAGTLEVLESGVVPQDL
jgi:muramoyltetrapeptide carboxypeptidase